MCFYKQMQIRTGGTQAIKSFILRSYFVSLTDGTISQIADDIIVGLYI